MQISSQTRINNPPTEVQRELVRAMFRAIPESSTQIAVLDLTLFGHDGKVQNGMLATDEWDLEASLALLGDGPICEVKAGLVTKEEFDAIPEY